MPKSSKTLPKLCQIVRNRDKVVCLRALKVLFKLTCVRPIIQSLLFNIMNFKQHSIQSQTVIELLTRGGINVTLHRCFKI